VWCSRYRKTRYRKKIFEREEVRERMEQLIWEIIARAIGDCMTRSVIEAYIKNHKNIGLPRGVSLWLMGIESIVCKAEAVLEQSKTR